MIPRTLFTCAMALLTLIAYPTKAQTTPDIVGDWHGNAAIQTGDQMMALTVTRSPDGTLKLISDWIAKRFVR